jgi:uncharacterized protein YkwD
MNYRKLVRFLASIVAILGLLVQMSVSSVAASELIIPVELEHAGLTFTSPLSFTDDSFTDPVTITFLSVDEVVPEADEEPVINDDPLLVESSDEKEVLAEEIVLPTPKKVLPSPTPTLKPLPPTVTLTLTPTETPASAPQATNLPSYATNGSLNADVLFSMANQKRAEAGLPAFEKHPEVCSVAESRKPEIENEVYGSSLIHAGFRTRSLPWRATENMISQNTEEQAMNWWMNSSIHRAAILGTAKYACVACQNKTCAMIFSSLDPK